MGMRGRFRAALDVAGIVALVAWISVATGFGLVYAISGDDAVVVMTAGPGERGREPRFTIKQGGFLDYVTVLEQRESCPGEVVYTYRSLSEDRLVVIARRGAKPGPVNVAVRYPVSIQLPPNVTPGLWAFESGRDSRCPLRQRYDTLASGLLEVTP